MTPEFRVVMSINDAVATLDKYLIEAVAGIEELRGRMEWMYDRFNEEREVLHGKINDIEFKLQRAGLLPWPEPKG